MTSVDTDMEGRASTLLLLAFNVTRPTWLAPRVPSNTFFRSTIRLHCRSAILDEAPETEPSRSSRQTVPAFVDENEYLRVTLSVTTEYRLGGECSAHTKALPENVQVVPRETGC